jgi:hypothetical protein
MQISDLPAKLYLPFGASAGGAYIRAIPVASQIGIVDGAASLTDGFVPLNATPIGAGGIPPDVRDMNGILNAATAWARWVGAGGQVGYDAALSTAIGGYPKGAVLMHGTTAGLFWVSTTDNNVTNPNAGGAGWQLIAPSAASNAETAAGTDAAKYVTPAALADQRASSADLTTGTSQAKLATALALAGLRADTATLATGTDVAKYATAAALAGLRATVGDVVTGTDIAKYVTPASLAGLGAYIGTDGHYDFPGGFRLAWKHGTATGNGYTNINWNSAFPTACFAAWCNGGEADNNAQDNNPYVHSYSTTVAQLFNARDNSVSVVAFGIGN